MTLKKQEYIKSIGMNLVRPFKSSEKPSPASCTLSSAFKVVDVARSQGGRSHGCCWQHQNKTLGDDPPITNKQHLDPWRRGVSKSNVGSDTKTKAVVMIFVLLTTQTEL
ncbi:hypothetical protein KUTeg_001322 [Tegillarca granosa]|uniref:Uncharacterized protein n=1 Tax=Tegillarca granosa TaxID=220873 RepID=A0ABQ9FV42_TEGGR|nr:hypothetical protein KUTeg_001322 [Tegillarca granosa]